MYSTFKEMRRMSAPTELIEKTQLTYQQIADKLGVSYTTVRNHAIKNFTKEFLSNRKRINYSAARSGVNAYDRSGTKNPNYKRGWWMDGQGYKCISLPGTGDYVYEHHLVYCKYHGLESIPEGMIVHHLDEVKQNNSPDNLQLMSQAEHLRIHREAMEDAKRAKRDYAIGLGDPRSQPGV